MFVHHFSLLFVMLSLGGSFVVAAQTTPAPAGSQVWSNFAWTI